MDQPAAAGKPSAAEATPSHPPLSTSSRSPPQEAKTHTHTSIPVSSSVSAHKSSNEVSKSSQKDLPSSTPSTDAKSCAKAANSVSATGSDSVSGMDRTLRAQEEARKLQFALAQQQVQQYQAMTKQLETQSGIAMTPTTSVAGLAKTSDDLQKLRTEQLARLQQNVQRQAQMAAQAVQKRSNEEWLRNKLLLEQEHLRLLRLHEQQSKGSGAANSIADSLLAQQQQVLRQQQMLREMLQKQQKQQVAQRQLQLQLQKGESANVAQQKSDALKKRKFKTAFDMDLEALARVCIRVANARTDCEMRQALDRMTTWLHRCTELQLLQLAQRDYRECIAHRRPMMEQQDRWPLDLQVKSEFIAQKIGQLVAAFLVREKSRAEQQAAAEAAKTAAVASAASSTATTTAAAGIKSASAASSTIASGSTSTPASSAGASSSSTVADGAAVTPAASASAASTPATASSGVSAATTTAGVGTTDAASKVADTPNQSKITTDAIATATAPSTTPATTIMAPAVRIPEKRDMAVVEREYAELKAQLQAKQVEINQKAKAKRDALKLEAAKAAGVVSDDATTAAMLAAGYKRPLHVEIPGSVKKPRTDSYVMQSSAPPAYRPSTTTIPAISPRVAQQFYDLDLSTRASTESEDKMYLPPKMVSKIMYKALPGTHEEESASTASSGVTIKQEGASKSKSHATPSATVFSSATHGQQGQVDDSSNEPVSISDDAVTFMQECVTEFLLYFTSEARDRSVMQNRRTTKGVGLSISGSNVVESMENLGFTSYARVLAGYNEKVKASQDAAAHKKMERKRLVKQQAMQRAAAAAAANIAANAAKAAAAGKSAVRPHTYLHPGLKPAVLSQYGAGRLPSSAAASTISRVTATASPARSVVASISRATATASPARSVVASPAGRPAMIVTPPPRPVVATTVAKPVVTATTTAPASTAATAPLPARPPTK